jgi:hypothetical protein
MNTSLGSYPYSSLFSEPLCLKLCHRKEGFIGRRRELDTCMKVREKRKKEVKDEHAKSR